MVRREKRREEEERDMRQRKMQRKWIGYWMVLLLSVLALSLYGCGDGGGGGGSSGGGGDGGDEGGGGGGREANAAPGGTAPRVTSTAPANGATGVATNTQITATFSEAMNPSTITTATFSLRYQGYTPV